MVTSETRAPRPERVDSGGERARAVREMFSAIAPRYDLLNHLLSLNIDRSWRRRAVNRLGWESHPEGRYLDVCAGTYDLSIELARRKAFAGVVAAVDFAHAMLHQGITKIEDHRITPMCADALALPLAPDAFDGAMVAFGVRNLTDIDAGLHEIRRVLQPGGRLVILDFALPTRQPLRGLYLLYFRRLLPFIGRLISKHSHAYTYLPESVLAFAEPNELAERMRGAGFTEVEWTLMAGGIACLWWGGA